MGASLGSSIWDYADTSTSFTWSRSSTISNYSGYSDCIYVPRCSGRASERFWGDWVDFERYWELQAKLFKEQVAIWRHVVLKPFLKIGRSKPRINIFQPVWSHLRRKSITSKTRQFRN